MSDETPASLLALLAPDAEPPAGGMTREDVVDLVAGYVTALLDRDRGYLLSLLYRIDVRERDVKEAFATTPPAALPRRLAELMVARHEEKLATRRAYARRPPPETC
ncbi:MAG: hypothetical protein R2834_07335 [Rhodothermales bacterium]